MSNPLTKVKNASDEPTWRGFDWDAITPRCVVCGEQSGQLDKLDTCPGCRQAVNASNDAARRPQAKKRARKRALARAPRPAAKKVPGPGRGNGSRAQRERLDRLGITVHAVKTWGVEQGLIARVTRGSAPAALVDAYVTAHDIQETSR